MIESPHDLEPEIVSQTSQVLGGDKAAGIEIGQVNHIDAAGSVVLQRVKGIFWVPDHDSHPGRSLENTVTFGIGL